MGIDAEMFVKTTHHPTQEELESWRCRLGDTFGPDNFWIRPRHPAIQQVEVIDQDSNEEPEIKPQAGEVLLKLNLATRYYGVDYERGDFLFIYGLARWLERNIPEAVVYYGGDSSGVLFRHFHHEAREALMKHFLEHGHSPYRDYFDPPQGKLGNAPQQTRPVCPTGDCGAQSLFQHGYGQTYIGLHCVACGRDVWTRDQGVTWQSGVQNWTNGQRDDKIEYQMTNGVDWEAVKT